MIKPTRSESPCLPKRETDALLSRQVNNKNCIFLILLLRRRKKSNNKKSLHAPNCAWHGGISLKLLMIPQKSEWIWNYGADHSPDWRQGASGAGAGTPGEVASVGARRRAAGAGRTQPPRYLGAQCQGQCHLGKVKQAKWASTYKCRICNDWFVAVAVRAKYSNGFENFARVHFLYD